MQPPNSILLVDNREEVRESTRRRLETKGYQVFVAGNQAEARDFLEKERIYLAIIDIRLEDEDNPNDVSGLDFATEIDPHIAKIILTGFSTEDLTRRALIGYLNQIAPAQDIIRKQDGPQALLEAVGRVFDRSIYASINFSLEIEFERGITIQKLLKPFDGIGSNLQEEVEELFRRLFRRENAIKIYYIPPGRGGGSIALVKPFYNGVEGSPVVIKFGAVERLKKEYLAYQDYVEPFVHRHSTILFGRPVRTHRLEGHKLLFVGCSTDNPRDFNSYYEDQGTTAEKLQNTIKDIFFRTCGIWYNGKREWDEDEDKTLSASMEYQLWGDLQLAFSELNDNLAQLSNGKSFHRVSFERSDPQHLQINIDNKFEALTDPLYFLRNYRDRIPLATFVAITHGDLNGRNILVDEGGMAWLIDFYRTGWGPALRDAAELESSIKFELIRSSNLPKLLAFECAVLEPTVFSEDIMPPKVVQGDNELQRALMTINSIRQAAWEISEGESMDEYYATLFYYALKMMTWKGVSSIDKKRQAIRQRHALYSAALLCNKFAFIENKAKIRIV